MPTQQQAQAQQEFVARLSNDLTAAANLFAPDDTPMGDIRSRVRNAINLVTVYKKAEPEKVEKPKPAPRRLRKK